MCFPLGLALDATLAESGKSAPREIILGHSVYAGGGGVEFLWYCGQIEDFGSEFKRDIKRRYPTPIAMEVRPSLRSDANYVDIDLGLGKLLSRSPSG
jgi:hypothetical protein